MVLYYVNRKAQNTGEHEVHNSKCEHLPGTENRIYIGYFDNCKDAVIAAKVFYSNVNGCFWCCKECKKR